MNSLITETLALLAQANPALVNNTTFATPWIDASAQDRLAFLLALGATDTTVDAKLQQASDNSGTGAADIPNKAITQFSATDDNKQAWLNLRSPEVGQTKTFVRLLATVANGSSGAQLSASAFGSFDRYDPAAHASTVAQIIA